MMDVWLPVVQTIKTLRHENAPLEVILSEIRISASRGVESTRSMVAMRGRAARLGGRSLGHIDPGAASAAILIESFANTLEQRAL